MHWTKTLALLLVCSLALTACGTTLDNSENPVASSSAASAPAVTSAAPAPTSGGAEAPAEMVTLRGWTAYSPPPAEGINGFNDQILWKEIGGRIGISVDWETVSDQDIDSKLGVMMASGDLPDLLNRVSPTNSEVYGRQGALKPLGDLIASDMPELTKLLEANPAVRAQITLPDGNIFYFPRMLLDTRTQTFAGYMMRGDWLENLGLDVPTTTDELYTVLKAFYENDPNGNGQADEVPFISNPDFIFHAFGVGSRSNANNTDFFLEDGQIKYGPTDPRYKDALEYLNMLYSEKLLDNEYNGMKGDVLNARASQNLGGFAFGSYAGYLTNWNKMIGEEVWVGMAPVYGPTGERNVLGKHTVTDPGAGACIATTSDKEKDVARLVDYLYSQEGQLLVDFGIEGDTYEIVNGVPTYTDKVANHETLNVLNYINAYVSHVSLWPTVLMPEHYQATLSDNGKEGNTITSQTCGDKKIPSLTFTTEELNESQDMLRDMNTYVDEFRVAFITGTRPLSEVETFQQNLNTMGVERLLAIYNASYQRYLEIAK